MNLITGTSSGLGKYLLEQIPDSYKYQEYIYKWTQKTKKIIHCGWDTQMVFQDYRYVENAIKEATELLKLPHKQFIFISTIDVYPKNGNTAYESHKIDVRDIVGQYALTKYYVEQLVLEKATNPIILRPGILLGPYTRGTIKNVAEGKDIKISVNSAYHFTLYEDILNVIKYAEDHEISGIYNVVGYGRVRPCELDYNIKGGTYIYDSGRINNAKIWELVPQVDRLSNREKYELWKNKL